MLGKEVRDAEGKLIAILRELNKSSEPLGSITITHRLEHEAVFLSERGVRYHLKIADARTGKAV
jgi:repressor of nif and glnA expression